MERPKLMAHQVKGVEIQGDKPAFYLAFDMGAGKTPTVLVNIDNLVKAGKARRILYVAPLSTLENVRRETVRFTDHLNAQLILGTRAVRSRKIREPGRHNVDIVNFDALRTLGEELFNVGYDMIVIDEAARIKSKDTATTRVATILGRKAKYRRCLSGLPFTEGVEDLFSQFSFLDPSIFGDNFYVFRNRYCTMATQQVRDKASGKVRKFHKITGYRNMDDLERRVASITMRVDKKDCLDLPDKTFVVRRIQMLEEQAKKYAAIETQAASEIGDGHVITHAVALSKIAKCRQIAAGFVYDDEHEPIYVPTLKYDVLVEILEEALHGNRKAVVFTSFRAEPLMVEVNIRDMKKHVEVFVMPDDPFGRQPTVDRWAAWKGPAVVVGNAASSGIGLNMTAADTAIFLSLDWKMGNRAQAIDRIHRIGSEIHSKITIFDLITEGTVEEDILKAVTEERDLVDCFLERVKGIGNEPAVQYNE
jgi:SNF2 family DNA or RNA helicase